jgi:hypothetical protein
MFRLAEGRRSMEPDRTYVTGRALVRLHSGSRMRTVIRGLVAAVDARRLGLSRQPSLAVRGES